MDCVLTTLAYFFATVIVVLIIKSSSFRRFRRANWPSCQFLLQNVQSDARIVQKVQSKYLLADGEARSYFVSEEPPVNNFCQ